MYLKYCSLVVFLFLQFLLHGQDRYCLSGNCQEGFGHARWKGGEEYIGNFVGSRMQGYGVFYWQNKRKYVGYWLAGKIDGKGTLFDDKGVIKTGIWKANKLIRLDRKQQGVNAETLRQAQQQLQQMMVDRPTMLEVVDSNNQIWQWVQQQMAGEHTQSLIYWQDTAAAYFPIPTGVKAVHAYPTATIEGRVWVKNTDDSEQMWSSLIFELHNIRNGSAFEQVEEAAKNWHCDKATYIYSYAHLEYQAAKATKDFYTTTWLPYCQNRGIKTTPQYWFYYLPDTFEGWWAMFDQEEQQGYPWHPYSGYYDKIVGQVIEGY